MPLDVHVDENMARRIRAAIALGGMAGVPDLAKKLDPLLRLGQDTLYDVLKGRRPLKDHEFDAIVAACGVPLAFYSVDLQRLPELLEPPGSSLPDTRDLQLLGIAKDGRTVRFSAEPVVRQLAGVDMQLVEILFAESSDALSDDLNSAVDAVARALAERATGGSAGSATGS